MHSVTSARGDPSRLETGACRESKLPEKYIPELKEAASAAGIKWEDFTVTDNTCPAKPMTKNLAAILGEDIDLVGLSLTPPSGPHIAAGWRHLFPFAPSTCTRVCACGCTGIAPKRCTPLVPMFRGVHVWCLSLTPPPGCGGGKGGGLTSPPVIVFAAGWPCRCTGAAEISLPAVACLL